MKYVMEQLLKVGAQTGDTVSNLSGLRYGEMFLSKIEQGGEKTCYEGQAFIQAGRQSHTLPRDHLFRSPEKEDSNMGSEPKGPELVR